jgi:2-polyprenyl-3-methyl-5-hydroxy-6-metoxy-1,4-benzoquinol methylase
MILKETQLDRDSELAKILHIPLEEVQSKCIAAPENIQIFSGTMPPAEDFTFLYEKFDYLDLIGYFRTLMATSVTRRGGELIKLLNSTRGKNCLDYGCGVGTHAIALMENGNTVSLLDVKGPLVELAVKRILLRISLKEIKKTLPLIYSSLDILPEEYFDLVICTDVLEHVIDPIGALRDITKSLKFGGQVFLRVSTMVKPSSGHFPESIRAWRKEGPSFLEANYKKVGTSIFEKK